jgi:hypothetical protein
MKCSYHPDVEAIDSCVSCGQWVCEECAETIDNSTFCRQCSLKYKNAAVTPAITGNTENKNSQAADEFKPNWFQRHLNWTFILSLLVFWGLTYGGGLFTGFVLAIKDPYVTEDTLSSVGLLVTIGILVCFLIPISAWILDQKGRSYWWLLMLFMSIGIIVFLCLENRRIIKPESKGGAYFVTRKSRISGKFVGVLASIVSGIIIVGTGVLFGIAALVPDEPTHYVSMQEIETDSTYWNTDWEGMDWELEDKTYDIADNYYLTHTYIEDETDCNDMAIDVWNMLHTEGIKSIIVIGNHYMDNEQFGDCDHAWLLVYDSEGYSFAVETTAGLLYFPEDAENEPEIGQYWEGFPYVKPSDLKSDLVWGW